MRMKIDVLTGIPLPAASMAVLPKSPNRSFRERGLSTHQRAGQYINPMFLRFQP
jgi:hypothetical protein